MVLGSIGSYWLVVARATPRAIPSVVLSAALSICPAYPFCS
ncbi:hypothetical protein KpIITR008_13 [Klebsiella phage KpIITR008]